MLLGNTMEWDEETLAHNDNGFGVQAILFNGGINLIAKIFNMVNKKRPIDGVTEFDFNVVMRYPWNDVLGHLSRTWF